MPEEYPFVLPVKSGQLEYNETWFRHVKKAKSFAKVPLLNILWAEVITSEGKAKRVIVSALAPQNSKLHLVEIDEELKPERGTLLQAQQWVKSLLDLAYNGVKRQRKLRILINPAGGKGKAVSIYERQVKALFAAAQCEVDMTVSERHGHMLELAQEMDLDYDAIVILSGDGGIHEVINGLAKHTEPHKALRTPIAQIPTGSANALSINHFGAKDGFDISRNCLNVIKGRPMKASIFSITQGDRHFLSFLTQAAGLMADLDLGTEHLRWMGDGRFILGYLQGVVTRNICPFEIEYKLVEGDKDAMMTAARKTASETHFHGEDEGSDEPDQLPWLSADTPLSEEGWTKFDKPILYLYAGGMPYVARDLMQFPMANPSDNCIDLVIQALANRGTLLKATIGAEKGEQFWIESQHYFKVSAYRFKPIPNAQGRLAVDGEYYPFEPFEVQVHADILRFLSLDGKYNLEAFNLNGGFVAA